MNVCFSGSLLSASIHCIHYCSENKFWLIDWVIWYYTGWWFCSLGGLACRKNDSNAWNERPNDGSSTTWRRRWGQTGTRCPLGPCNERFGEYTDACLSVFELQGVWEFSRCPPFSAEIIKSWEPGAEKAQIRPGACL